MTFRIRDFYYYVEDMPRATAFYRDVLGMTVREADDWWTALDCGGQLIGLHWTGGDPVPAVPRDDHGAKAGGTLTLAADDIDIAADALRAKGVTILGDINRDPWGSLLSFVDTEGNVLKVMGPPPPQEAA